MSLNVVAGDPDDILIYSRPSSVKSVRHNVTHGHRRGHCELTPEQIRRLREELKLSRVFGPEGLMSVLQPLKHGTAERRVPMVQL